MHNVSESLGSIAKPAKLAPGNNDAATYGRQEYARTVAMYNQLVTAVGDNDRDRMEAAVEHISSVLTNGPFRSKTRTALAGSASGPASVEERRPWLVCPARVAATRKSRRRERDSGAFAPIA